MRNVSFYISQTQGHRGLKVKGDEQDCLTKTQQEGMIFHTRGKGRYTVCDQN